MKYKDGDKVVAMTNEFDTCDLGDILTVKDDYAYELDYDSGYYLGGGYINTHWLNSNNHGRFEEYKEKKEMQDFDLKSNTWFIRVKNANELSAVAKWLEEFGIKPQFSANWVNGINCIYKDSKSMNTFVRTNTSDVVSSENEIVVEFERTTVVKSVEYPKSEKQKRIEELQLVIKQANEELEELLNE